MAWLRTEDVYEQYIEAVDNNGETLGYIFPSEARKLGIKTINIEKPQKFIKDSYVTYHTELLIKSGVLTSGRDLNEVQTVLLLGSIINEKKEQVDQNKINFEQLLFANSPEMYKSYKEHEEQRRLAENPEYEQVRPKSLQELLSMFDAFNDDTESIQDRESSNISSGWLDDLLDEDEISQIRD